MGAALMAVLTVLKAIGWILLALVGLLLLLLLIVLFVPLTYSLEGEKKQGSAWVTVRAGWLLDLVRFRLVWREGKTVWSVRAAWKTLASQPPAERKPKRRNERPVKEEPVQAAPPEGLPSPSREPDKPSGAAQDPGTGPEAGTRSRIRLRENKERTFWGKLAAIRRELGAYPEKGETLAVLKRLAGKVLRTLFPRRIRARVRFGMEDPASTGYILGVCRMAMPFLPAQGVTLVPDFQEKVLEAEGKAVGRFTVGRLLRYIVWACLDRHTRFLIAYIRNQKG